MSWRKIALEPKFKGIPHSTLRYIAGGHNPKSEYIRKILKLPSLVPVEVCPVCGIVHIKSCPQKRPERSHKSIKQLIIKEQEWKRLQKKD